VFLFWLEFISLQGEINMNWIILLIIIFITDLIVLLTCGVGGGMMFLVILNGYMSMPTPAAVGFLSSLYCVGITIPALFGGIFVKLRKAEEIRIWHVIGISIVANMALSIFIGLVLYLIQNAG
jgi:hypothetical protein